MTRMIPISLAVLSLSIPSSLAASPTAAQLFYSTSNTGIPAGQSFLLGGDQRRPLRVQGVNIGPVEVVVSAVGSEGAETLARALPGESFSATLQPGVAARITNASITEPALVRVRFSASTGSVGMRYVPADGAPAQEP